MLPWWYVIVAINKWQIDKRECHCVRLEHRCGHVSFKEGSTRKWNKTKPLACCHHVLRASEKPLAFLSSVYMSFCHALSLMLLCGADHDMLCALVSGCIGGYMRHVKYMYIERISQGDLHRHLPTSKLFAESCLTKFFHCSSFNFVVCSCTVFLRETTYFMNSEGSVDFPYSPQSVVDFIYIDLKSNNAFHRSKSWHAQLVCSALYGR